MSYSDNETANRRILVVDDQESIREDFRKIIGQSGPAKVSPSDARSAFFGDEAAAENGVSFSLDTASQGLEGVERVEGALRDQRPYAMAFVDVRMPPGIDGVQTIKKMWESDPDLQVVICTAYSDYSFDEIMKELGQSDRLLILKKPFDPVEVRQLAGALTEKWNMIQRDRERMQELRVANEKAEAANRAKTDFLANMSHEIRTPMNAVLGYIDLMCDPGATADERERYGRTVKRSGEHLLAILNDILDVSRIEASRLVINAADFSPFELAFEVCSLLRSAAAEKDLDLSLQIATPLPNVVESDLVRVRQILLNLVGNAIKFTHQGSVRVVLRLDEVDESEHRYLHFDVIDTGIGIEPGKLSEVFEPFRQADNSCTREYGGTGLGLTICRRLALLLGGDVEVHSRPGEGTTFSLKLYAGELDASMLRAYSGGECDLASPSEPPSAPVREDVRLAANVLVVEDVKFNQMLVAAMLRRAGARVTLAENGVEACRAVERAQADEDPFDVVLMDMQMPVMDGYDATRKLRAAGFQMPIIALTARAMTGDRERCIAAGCTDYATKPLDKPALLRACARLVAQESTPPALPAQRAESRTPVD